ncbi:MAG: hypothetical protein FWD32_02945, partial [Firmicutes bacterium]|nr:hypothetical protein [Bacillota bacterium]
MKIVAISNSFIKHALIFLIIFVWCNFYLKNLILSVFLSTLATFAIYLVLKRLQAHKTQKLLIKRNLQKEIDNAITQFSFLTKTEQILFFNDAFTKLAIVDSYTNKYIKLKGGTLIFTEFNKQLDDITAMCAIALQNKCNKIIILCASAVKGLTEYAKTIKTLEIIILEKDEVYLNVIAPSGIKPPQLIEISK